MSYVADAIDEALAQVELEYPDETPRKRFLVATLSAAKEAEEAGVPARNAAKWSVTSLVRGALKVLRDRGF